MYSTPFTLIFESHADRVRLINQLNDNDLKVLVTGSGISLEIGTQQPEQTHAATIDQQTSEPVV